MSAAFLADILKIENSIRWDSSQPCCICLQNFGTMSSETGVVEYGVRLPCSHYVGSSCIATWLSSNNTCPICRHVFFPAQPRPYLADGTTADQSHSYRLWCANCSRLDLSNRAIVVAAQLVAKLRTLDWLQAYTPNCLGSVAIYAVSHIMGEPKSPEDISPLFRDMQPDLVRSVYRFIHPRRDQLVSRELLIEPAARAHAQGVFAMLLSGANLANMLALLPTPTEVIGFIRSKAEAPSLTGLEYGIISRRENINEHLGGFCTQLGYDHTLVGGFINLVCREIAHNIRRAMILDFRSPQPIMAVGIYMGSHLLCVGTSIKRISEVVGVSERTIRTAYGSVYPRRAELVESRFFNTVSPVKVHQSLAWPALT